MVNLQTIEITGKYSILPIQGVNIFLGSLKRLYRIILSPLNCYYISYFSLLSLYTLQHLRKFLPFLLINFLSLNSIFAFDITPQVLNHSYDRAIFLEAEKYSPNEFLDAKKKYEELTSPKTSDEEKFSENKLVYSLLRKASLNSILKAIESKKKLSLSTLELSVESFSESLSSEYYGMAKDLYSEAEISTSDMSNRLQEAFLESDIQKQDELFETILGDTETSLKKWEESTSFSKKSIALSLSQISALVDSQSDLYDTIQLLRRYRSPEKQDSVQLAILEKEIKEGIDTIQEGKVKKGFQILEGIRIRLHDLVTEDFRIYSKSRVELSKKKLQLAEENLAQEKQKFNEEPEILSQLEDNLNAARESHELAEKLMNEEKYLESIAKSEDSLFLTERFKEDLELTIVPEKKLYDEDIEEPKQVSNEVKEKHYSGKKLPKTHRVNRGETLVQIALYYYGSPRGWKMIFKKNKKSIKNPNVIFPNQKIILPKK